MGDFCLKQTDLVRFVLINTETIITNCRDATTKTAEKSVLVRLADVARYVFVPVGA